MMAPRSRLSLLAALSLIIFVLAFYRLGLEVHLVESGKPAPEIQDPGSNSDSVDARLVKKVAVIGAGSGGSSAAYYLRKFAAGKDFELEITVYEKNNYVGGRSTTVNVYDNPEEPVELGASIFVKVNENLLNASKEFGLEYSDNYISRRQADDALGVYDGQKFIFRQSYDNPWWNNLAIIFKYGLTPIRTQQLVKTIIGKFLQMYKAPLFPFRSLTEAAMKTDLIEATSHTGEQFLDIHGVGGKFATDLVQASTRVNYAQNLGLIHGLETMVCMATNGAISIKGGNWKIFKGMLDSSKAKVHLNTAVTKLNKMSNKKKWIVTSSPVSASDVHQDEKHGANASAHTEEFDAVILASPYQFSNIEIHSKLAKTPVEIPYVKLHVTLFTSPLRLSPEFFGVASDKEVPDMVLTTLNSTEQAEEKFRRGEGVHGVGGANFFSISLLRSLARYDNGGHKIEYLYKIFSPTEMGNNQIKKFLGVSQEEEENVRDDQVITWAYRKLWHSYPYLYPRVTFEDIILDGDETLYYTSGIESFISTMETSSLMGMNVAKLLVNSWDEGGKYTAESRLPVENNVEEELKVKARH
ncbi:Prenylcysteine lyase-domain-containing protein [Kalaharituber pfeilii]|nr:Prenylcysteine lyase-domain-containing protein [Kalaharituber pfeilii]